MPEAVGDRSEPLSGKLIHVPVTPFAAAVLVAICFALPFGVAALVDDGPAPQPGAKAQPAVEVLDETAPAVRVATLTRVPRLPRLRSEPEPAAAPAATATPTTTAPATAVPPSPAPTPAPSSSGGGGSRSGGNGGGGSNSGSGFDSSGSGNGGSDSFDSTG